jgi:hypothetical protein
MADDQILSLLAQQGQFPGGASMVPGAGETPSAPMGSPMSTPEPKNGQREAALVNLSMAQDLIEQSLPAIGSETPEGQKLISALNSMTAVIGPKKDKAKDLQSAEILQLLQNLPQAGGGAPGARQLAAAGPNLGQMTPPPPGGGAPAMPPGMPPGMGGAFGM